MGSRRSTESTLLTALRFLWPFSGTRKFICVSQSTSREHEFQLAVVLSNRLLTDWIFVGKKPPIAGPSASLPRTRCEGFGHACKARLKRKAGWGAGFRDFLCSPPVKENRWQPVDPPACGVQEDLQGGMAAHIKRMRMLVVGAGMTVRYSPKHLTLNALMPGWRNWQTQRTQNPPTLAVMGVRPPLPAP